MGKAEDGPYRHACQECKTRHLKCDGLHPCTKCVSTGKRCDLTGSTKFLFRHDHNPSVTAKTKSGKRKKNSEVQWSQHQEWVPAQANLRFIDKSNDLDFLEESESQYDEEVEDPGALPKWHTVEVEQSGPSYKDVQSTGYPIGLGTSEFDIQSLRVAEQSGHFDTNLLEQNLRSSHDYSAIDPALRHTTTRQEQSSLPSEAFLFTDHLFTPSINDSEYPWPLQNDDEVTLLRHFIIELCPWFDYCDRDKHFRNLVLPASATDLTLLNAILAVAARHLGLQGNFDRYAADRYQRKCLESLIPELNDQDTVPKDLLFAGTILLRLLDEMTEDDPTIRNEGHGLSTRNLIRGREESLYESSLRVACLRIELRQEIIISFLTRKPVPLIAQFCNIDSGLKPTDDWTWAYRMIACVADCLNLCYGAKRGDFAEEHKRLTEYADGWSRHCSPTFKPIGCLSAGKSNGTLPKIWFLDDCHLAGHHHLGLLRILLLAHDPSIPSIGLDRKMRIEQIDV